MDCGNGVKAENEECDDGNLIDGDGCSSLCVTEKSESYKAAVGVAAGGTAVGAVAAVAGSSASSVGGVGSSLIGTSPVGQMGSAVAENVVGNLAQNAASNAAQNAGQNAAQHVGDMGKHLGQLKNWFLL